MRISKSAIFLMSLPLVNHALKFFLQRGKRCVYGGRLAYNGNVDISWQQVFRATVNFPQPSLNAIFGYMRPDPAGNSKQDFSSFAFAVNNIECATSVKFAMSKKLTDFILLSQDFRLGQFF